MARRSSKADPSGQRRHGPRDAARGILPDFQGREADIARIEKLLDHVGDGGKALLISGEAGIGKTTLLEFAQVFARQRGFRVLYMSGVIAEAHLPFAALQQAVGPILRQAEKLPQRQHAALLAAFGLGDDTTVPDTFLVALATLTLLTESAVRKPILLVADDIQWLDQPSHDVLSFISRRLSSDPIVLLMAARSDSEEAFPHWSVPRHQLTRLDAAAAERLLDAESPDLPLDLRQRFLDVAAGNPLALVELPRGERKPETGESHWVPLTDRLERAFFSRVSVLPTATRALLLIIAENDSRSIREVLDAGEVLLHEKVALETLAPAASARLIEIAAGEVRFRHPLVRSAIHQASSPVMRHNIHAALSRVIIDEPDRRIWHRMASAVGPDEALAAELDAAAARSQRRGA
ncbi:MAG: LuxR family transcriptional regulator, partial [Rhizobiales bacterium 39-66-18]